MIGANAAGAMPDNCMKKEKGKMAQLLNVVIDISHHQKNVDFGKVKADGIVGVIHKATQGFRFVDERYEERRQRALDAGLLWGAYHFGVGGDASEQADHFLNVVNPDEQTLLALDYEPNPQGPTMTLNQARDFVTHVNDVVGRFPGLYSGHLIKEQLGNVTEPDPVLRNCFLWIAQFRDAPTRIPPTFPTFTFHQYTDGAVGPEPHEVEGIGPCDRDRFNGGLENLKKLWGVKTE
jgi:lysozyme